MSNAQPQEKKITVTVDNEQTKALALELARANLLNEKLVDTVARREVKDDHDDLATKKLQVYQKFGDSRALDCSTVEELRDFVTQKINSANQPTPAGSPLVPQQYGRKDDLYTHHYSDFGSMVSDLREKMHNAPTEQERKRGRELLLSSTQKINSNSETKPRSAYRFLRFKRSRTPSERLETHTRRIFSKRK